VYYVGRNTRTTSNLFAELRVTVSIRSPEGEARAEVKATVVGTLGRGAGDFVIAWIGEPSRANNGTYMPESTTLDERVEGAIVANPYLSRRKLRFETEDGRVVLTGEVGTYFQKQMAQEIVRRVEGVTEIENCLEVKWHGANAECGLRIAE